MDQYPMSADLTEVDEPEVAEEERRRRRAAMLVLFAPQLVALLAAVIFVTTIVGPRIAAVGAGLARDDRISAIAPQAAAKAAELMSGTYDSADDEPLPAPKAVQPAPSDSSMQPRATRTSRAASEKTSASSSTRPKAPRPSDSDPGQDSVGAPDSTTPAVPEAPEVTEPVPVGEGSGHGPWWLGWTR